MKKIFFFSLLSLSLLLITATAANAKTSGAWNPSVPDGYSPISWVSGHGIQSFMKAPQGNGTIDYLTLVYLPDNLVNFISSSSAPLDWGPAAAPFAGTTAVQDWAVARLTTEAAKASAPDAKFIWNAPFFNENLATTNLSLALKTTSASGTVFITSGSRPNTDMAKERRTLTVDNAEGTATIGDFDAAAFSTTSTDDQAVEGFAPDILKTDGNGTAASRLFLGVADDGKELVIYCSQEATPDEASQALAAAGVATSSQMQADGGGSATCGYNLPGQYFVEPDRTLPYLMGAFPLVERGAVTVDILNVRSGPGTKFDKVNRLQKDDAVIAYAEKNGWLKISNYQDEWVSADYIKNLTP